jgi:hypothetical protein
MADFQVKAEEESSSEPQESLGMFVDDNVDPEFLQHSSPKKAPLFETLAAEPEWRRCEGAERLKQVNIKEFAAENAYLALRKILQTLSLHLASNASCQPRIDKIRRFSFPVPLLLLRNINASLEMLHG